MARRHLEHFQPKSNGTERLPGSVLIGTLFSASNTKLTFEIRVLNDQHGLSFAGIWLLAKAC